MTSLLMLIFPGLRPAATVENFGGVGTPIVLPDGMTDDLALERQLDERLDRPVRR